MKLIQMQYKMDAIFINSENSKTSDSHRLLILNLSDEINLKRNDKYVALSQHLTKKEKSENVIQKK